MIVNRSKKTLALCGSGIISLCFFLSAFYFSADPVQLKALVAASQLVREPEERYAPVPSPFQFSPMEVGGGGGQNFPAPPAVPKMPGVTGQLDGRVKAIGVLPPKIAIIEENGKSKTVSIGDQVGKGRITEITEDGIVVGGQFLALEAGGRTHAEN